MTFCAWRTALETARSALLPKRRACAASASFLSCRGNVAAIGCITVSVFADF
jgi:hypothetical protein